MAFAVQILNFRVDFISDPHMFFFMISEWFLSVGAKGVSVAVVVVVVEALVELGAARDAEPTRVAAGVTPVGVLAGERKRARKTPSRALVCVRAWLAIT